jgi:hypothetical protein
VKLNMTALITLKQVAGVAEALNPKVPSVVSVFAGRIADTGVDPMPMMKRLRRSSRAIPRPNSSGRARARSSTSSRPRRAGCAIITVPHDILAKAAKMLGHGSHGAVPRHGEDLRKGRGGLRLQALTQQLRHLPAGRTPAILRVRPFLHAHPDPPAPGLLLAALSLSGPLRAANLDGSSPEVGNAEAVRLYVEANDFVTNMAERQYSYDYLQFYWKRAQSNIDRIRRVYPDSPTSQSLARGDLKIGPYPLDYFKERVLYDLELKRVGAYDDVNCAIFLYGLDPTATTRSGTGPLRTSSRSSPAASAGGRPSGSPSSTVHRPLAPAKHLHGSPRSMTRRTSCGS